MPTIQIAGLVDTTFNLKNHHGEYWAFQYESTENIPVDVSNWETKPDSSLLDAQGRLPKEAAKCRAWSFENGTLVSKGSVNLFRGPVMRDVVAAGKNGILLGYLTEVKTKAGYSATVMANTTDEAVSVATLQAFAAALEPVVNG